MKNKCLVVVIASLFLYEVQSNQISAKVIHKCSRKDDLLCIKDNIKKALPKIAKGSIKNVDALDPFTIDNIQVLKVPDLKLSFTNLTFMGIKDCEIRNVTRQETNLFYLDEGKLSMTFLCSLKISGKYNMEGMLLIFPVKGDGQTKFTLNKLAFKLECDHDVINRESWIINACSHKISLRDKARIEFENLYDTEYGHNVPSVHRWIIKSPNDIVMEIFPEIFVNVTKKIEITIKQFLQTRNGQ